VVSEEFAPWPVIDGRYFRGTAEEHQILRLEAVGTLLAALPQTMREEIRMQLIKTVIGMLALRELEHKKLLAQAANVLHQTMEFKEFIGHESAKNEGGWGTW
jgi:hypothetical protein